MSSCSRLFAPILKSLLPAHVLSGLLFCELDMESVDVLQRLQDRKVSCIFYNVNNNAATGAEDSNAL